MELGLDEGMQPHLARVRVGVRVRVRVGVRVRVRVVSLFDSTYHQLEFGNRVHNLAITNYLWQ